jgi:hypothetical protein
MAERIKHKRGKVATELVSILRWEDDGGKTTEPNHLKLNPPFVQTMPVQGASSANSLLWNRIFVIEPFQANAGIRLIKRKTPGKSEAPACVTAATRTYCD